MTRFVRCSRSWTASSEGCGDGGAYRADSLSHPRSIQALLEIRYSFMKVQIQRWAKGLDLQILNRCILIGLGDFS